MDIARTDQAQQRRRRIIWIAATVAGLLFSGGLAYVWLDPGVPRIAADRLWVDTVRFGDFERNVRGTGVLTPKVKRSLTAQSIATVEHITAQPGMRVKANDVVLEMSNPELFDQLEGARATLAAAQSDETSKRLTLEGQVMDLESSLATLRADHGYTRIQAEREGKLIETKLISDLQYMQTRQKLEALTEQMQIGERRLAGMRHNAAEQIASGRARIEQLRRVAVQRERQIDALQVRAGIDGVVQSIDVSEGKQVAAGSSLGLVVQTSPLQVKLSVPEVQAKDLEPGMQALIDIRSATFRGRIARIAPSVQNAAVEVLIEPEGKLPPEARPELGVSGTVQIDRIPQVLTIPRPPEARQNSTGALYLLDDNGRANRISVRFGRASSDRIEIVSGLGKGDRVVLSNLAEWNNPISFLLR